MNTRKDLARRLEGAGGKKYWRTLEELAETEAFQELMRQEFPGQSGVWPSLPSRRQFLTVMGASLALAGLTGCNVRPANSITMVPYIRAPEEIVPGKPLFYATTMTLGGASVGLLVESHMGRPTKIEGNLDHPASLGATDRFSQASILTMYDPDRSKQVTRLGQPVTWSEALASLRDAMDGHRSRRGAGLRLLTETVVSPTLGDQLDRFFKEFPEAKWHQYEPLAADNAHRAAVLGFGAPVNTYYRFYDLDKKQRTAEVILSIDADFLTCGPGNLRYVAEFAAGRRQRIKASDDAAKMREEARQATMSRLYVVETELTPTGAKADHRLALRPRDVEAFARALAAELKVPNAPPAPGGLPEAARKWLPVVAADLRSHGPGTSVVLAGDRQPVAVQLLVHAINEHLGNVGKTVLHTDPIQTRPVEQMASLRELAEALDGDAVETLLIFGANAAFTAPRDLDFAARLEKFSKGPKHLSVHLGLYQDETARLRQWHLPEAYYLEAWSDGRAFDGTASIAQPLIEPLYHGRSAHELLAVLAGGVATPSYELVRAYWRKHWEGKKQKGEGDFEDFWETSVHDGKVADTTFTPNPDLRLKDGWRQHVESDAATRQQTGEYDLVFQQDPTIYDGRFANNGWLQELPKPITRIAWDNAALMSPATAKELVGVTTGTYAHGGEHGGYHQPVIEIQVGQETVQAPVWAVPGQAERTITVHLGYGREYAGKVGGDTTHRVGFNAYPLRTTAHLWWRPIAKPRATSATYQLACTQQHQLMENRNIVRSATLAEYQKTPNFAQQMETDPGEGKTDKGRMNLPTLYPPQPEQTYKWGMAIDLTACVGCKACVVACQAENNIPVVGKDQVLAGRMMHWLRIDRYNTGPYEAPEEFYFQPVPCMHCENAPCEYVCPVEATLHSADGLNEMIYQRCVGTRYCSNNCPYKVRRFNFFHYADYATESLKLQYNPDVTVRSRGVMEKCSYCVQRIRVADIDAQREERRIRDGEILTACQAACPAGAIVFGDLHLDGEKGRPVSEVNKLKQTPLEYGLYDDLNTKPRTTYLAALRNPNPELEA